MWFEAQNRSRITGTHAHTQHQHLLHSCLRSFKANFHSDVDIVWPKIHNWNKNIFLSNNSSILGKILRQAVRSNKKKQPNYVGRIALKRPKSKPPKTVLLVYQALRTRSHKTSDEKLITKTTGITKFLPICLTVINNSNRISFFIFKL